jgi:hypothetical protein
MKRIKITAVLTMIFVSICTFAQSPGKVYALGDTIVLDGITSLVFKLDATSQHGTAMSPIACSDEQNEKRLLLLEKSYQKSLRKKEITEEEYNALILNLKAEIEARKQIPIIEHKREKNGTTFFVDVWEEKLPAGWRLPSLVDAENFATFFCGGLGKSYAKGATFTVLGNKLNSNGYFKQDLFDIAQNGFICGKNSTPEGVRFLQRWEQRLPVLKQWFVIDEKFTGYEKTVGVKDF